MNAVTGEPVKKVRLLLQRSGTPYATTTDSAGHFLIDEVDAGHYTLWAYRNGFPDQAYSPNGGKAHHASIFELSAGQDLKEIVFKLVPSAVITGRILDEDGDPVADASVDCMKFEYDHGKRQFFPEGSTTTNEIGEFRLVVEWARRCAIKASHGGNVYDAVEERPRSTARTGLERYVPTYYPNTVNQDRATVLDVPAGARISGINVTLLRTRTVQIKGHVTGPAECLGQTNVNLAADNWSRSFTADLQGRFQMGGLVPGPYSLQAGCMLQGRPIFAQTAIEVRDENVEGIELTLQPMPSIQGRVILEGNVKGANLELEIQSADGAHETIPLAEDLTFTKNPLIAPGLFEFRAEGVGPNVYIKSVRMGDHDITDTGFDTAPGVVLEAFTIVLSPNAGVVEGSVKNSKEDPAAGALITLIPDADHRALTRRYKTTTTDQNGHFTLRGVIPGDYKIYAWEDMEGDAYEDPDLMKAHEADGQELSIKESGHETVQLKLIPAGVAPAALEVVR